MGDPNTEYLTAAEYTSLKNRTARSYSGVGLTVEPSRAGLVVTSALRGPAREAGVRPGDIIVRIEGRPAGRLTFDQSVNLIKGEKGTVVHLTVRRENGRRLAVAARACGSAHPSELTGALETGHPIGGAELALAVLVAGDVHELEPAGRSRPAHVARATAAAAATSKRPSPSSLGTVTGERDAAGGRTPASHGATC